ncbi:MAG: exodeoxyribonuclease VII small subunit [Victivallaceae bacterium]|nr:exodeoxyribonuclease VII small subunit [Victivallaceae bacterium]
MTKEAEKNYADLTFEQALAELEKLVETMERGELPLDDMIGYFEKGTILAKLCRQKLSRLEKKIEVLVKDDGNSGEWREFDTSSERKQTASPPPNDGFTF